MITPSFGLTATERVLPKLALDFTTALLDSRITFTRTTGASNPATYVDSGGVITTATNNQPRFDYDPVTLVCKGLLIEESRTNLALYSEDFTNAFWTKGGTSSISATLITSPANITNANILVGANGTDRNGNVLLRTYTGLTSGISYTVSYYVIGQGGTTATLYTRDATTGSVGGTTLALTGSWQRITRTITLGASTTACNTYLGNTNGDIGIWGGQFEAGAFTTSYIPTTTTALTRNADVATMTGTNFSSWFNASEGTMIAEGSALSTVGNRFFALGSNGSANYHLVYAAGATTVAGGATQATFTNTVVANTVYRIGYSYKANSFLFAVNGGATQSDTSGSLPTGLDRAEYGSIFAGSLFAGSGHLREMLYYPLQLTSSEVQAFSKQG